MIHDSGGHGLYVGGIDDTTGCRHPQPQRQGAHSMIDFFMRRRRGSTSNNKRRAEGAAVKVCFGFFFLLSAQD